MKHEFSANNHHDVKKNIFLIKENEAMKSHSNQLELLDSIINRMPWEYEMIVSLLFAVRMIKR